MTKSVRCTLAYGRSGVEVTVPEDATVVTAIERPPADDPVGAVRDSLQHPIEGRPLREAAAGAARVVVVFPDVTRPMPNQVVLPAVLAELTAAGVTREQIELICATGTHRPATPNELTDLVGETIFRDYLVRNHVADDGDHVQVGSVDATPILLDRAYVEADVRVLTGFVEPHFFAGFSGGPKAVCPGLAALETTLEAHSPARITNARSTWLELEANPVHSFIRAAVALAPPTFTVDVTINREKQLVRAFAGTMSSAHAAATDHVRSTAVRTVGGRFGIVVTTNGGYPLDRNLYQAVKGIAAAASVVVEGGTIVMAAECIDGIPDNSAFSALIASGSDLLDPNQPKRLDLWQAQVLGRVLRSARVDLFSAGIRQHLIRGSGVRLVTDVQEAIDEALARAGTGTRVCVLPEGPLTVAVTD